MDQKLTKEMAERRAVRQNLVKTADRSEKIRTYNYAQVDESILFGEWGSLIFEL
jgi:protein subunit release factor A